MKSFVVFLSFALLAVLVWAQAAPPTPATPPPMHGQMMGMHHSMPSMQDQAAKMRATLEKMKANLAKITDPALKQQAQLDVDLWEEMVQHMENMAKMMEAHRSMGMMNGVKAHPPMPDQQPQAPEKK